MFEKALVPLDGSEPSRGILDLGHALLERPGTRVVLLRVLPSSVPGGSATERDALRELEPTAASLRARGAAVEARVRRGDPAEQILEGAAAEGCSWILMATHGRTGLARWLRGSVAERVLRAADVPVLVANPLALGAVPELALKKILVPLDGSERSARIVPLAAELARAHGSELVLQRVVEAPLDAPTLPPAEEAGPVEAELRVEAKRLAGVRVHILVSRGAPAPAIVDAARDQGVDLVALATHGRTGLARWAFGSVAEQVVRHCACPLLTLRTVARPAGPERG